MKLLWKSKVYLAELEDILTYPAAEDILDQGERIEIAHHQGLCDY